MPIRRRQFCHDRDCLLKSEAFLVDRGAVRRPRCGRWPLAYEMGWGSGEPPRSSRALGVDCLQILAVYALCGARTFGGVGTDPCDGFGATSLRPRMSAQGRKAPPPQPAATSPKPPPQPRNTRKISCP